MEDPSTPSEVGFELTEAQAAQLEARGFFVIDELVPAEVALRARQEILQLHRSGRLSAAGIGRGHSHRHLLEIRGDQTTWLTEAIRIEHSGLAQLERHFVALGAALNRRAYLGLDGCEIQLARYPGLGEGYRRHRDTFADPNAPQQRRVTAILYLNPTWTAPDGGLLRLYTSPESDPFDLEPILSRAVVFLSDEVEHEVLPCHRERVATTAWYLTRTRPV